MTGKVMLANIRVLKPYAKHRHSTVSKLQAALLVTVKTPMGFCTVAPPYSDLTQQ